MNYFTELKLEQSVLFLQNALLKEPENPAIAPSIETAKYWQPRLAQLKNNPDTLNALLDDFVNFSFAPSAARFKVNLLHYIADQFSSRDNITAQETATVFDCLLKTRSFDKAILFVDMLVSRHPENHEWLYLLAQAHWQNGSSGIASRLYVQALLHAPCSIQINRIESEQIKELITEYGPFLAPAYAWIRGIASFVNSTFKEDPADEQHRKALVCYSLLWQANECLERNDQQKSIGYRQKLKELEPDLYAAYFELLAHR